jgi:4-hydroxy-tetrahydrodipicolinate synthase
MTWPDSAARLARLSGSVCALATPFRDGAIDADALALLVRRQIAAGTAALVACGSTGEAPALSPAEHAAVVRHVVVATGGRIPVIAGATGPATDSSCALAESAARAGASALLLAPPAYVRPTQEGIFAHVRAVAHAADLPVMLYDVPGRTGVAIADATVARLFEAGLIVALKDATGDLARPPRLAALCGPGLRQFTGEDASALGHRAMGGVGCISVTANVAPALCAAMQRAWERGDRGEMARLRDMLDPLHRALFAESNPIPLKAALALLRLCDDAPRLPLTRACDATTERLASVLAPLQAAELRAMPRARLAVAV